MGLFVDGPACTVDDLTDHDSGLLDVALSSGINLGTKLRLAQEEIQSDLQLWLLRTRSLVDPPGWQGLRVDQVVVTPPLKRWETMHALALVYRDAYFGQLVDRYEGKWREYMKLTRDVREDFIARGVGIVADPLPLPAAPAVSSMAAPQSGGSFYARIAWVNSRGQESAASVASSITISDGNLMVVTPVAAPANAVGYRVYAGAALEGLVRQNSLVLPVNVPFRYVPGLVTQGALPGSGQAPDFIRPLARTLLRG